MGEEMILRGNVAAAYGAKLCRPAVVAAYPITPQTTVVEKIAEFVNNGEMKCEYIKGGVRAFGVVGMLWG